MDFGITASHCNISIVVGRNWPNIVHNIDKIQIKSRYQIKLNTYDYFYISRLYLFSFNHFSECRQIKYIYRFNKSKCRTYTCVYLEE